MPNSSESHLVGPEIIDGRSIFQLFLSSPDQWPEKLDRGSQRYALLIAGDSSRWTLRQTDTLVSRALDSGAIYVCALGRGCEQLELAFDMECVSRNPRPRVDSVIMTTAHHDMAEAVFFFLNCAKPAPRYLKSCKAWVAVTIGDRRLFGSIRRSVAARKRSGLLI